MNMGRVSGSLLAVSGNITRAEAGGGPRYPTGTEAQTAVSAPLALRQVSPVGADSDFYHQRHGEGVSFFHELAHQGAHDVKFGFGDFEDQFVVHLEGHAGPQVALAESGVDTDHGELDQVRGGALQRGVDGGAFREPALVGGLGVSVRNRPDTSEQRRYSLLAAGLFKGQVDEGADACVFCDIGADELLGFSGFDAQLLREAECGETVNDAKINDLSLAAVVRGDQQRRNAKNLGGCEGMDVVSAAKGFDQQRVFRIVGEQAELNLRVVRGQQDVAGLGGEGSTDLTAKFGANGNVLQVRVGRR